MTSIETHPTGLYLDFENPKLEQVDVQDIALALSNTCRFGGHVSRYYSVAEHAVRVSWLMEERGCYPEAQLAGLHHDSHEAYIGDLPTPLKRLFGMRVGITARKIDRLIALRIGLDGTSWFHCDAVLAADRTMLRLEAGQLKLSGGVGEHWTHVEPLTRPEWVLGWTPEQARAEFLMRHGELTR